MAARQVMSRLVLPGDGQQGAGTVTGERVREGDTRIVACREGHDAEHGVGEGDAATGGCKGRRNGCVEAVSVL